MVGDSNSQMDRIEGMLTQLVRVVGSTNDKVAELQKGQARLESAVEELQKGQTRLEEELTETKDTVYRIEHRLQVLERKQDKMTVRLDTVETELELLKEKTNP